jgi:ATP-binding cassette subfamily B protein
MLSAISESVVGAATIRAYGVEQRTAGRIDQTVEAHRVASVRAQARSVVAFTSGQMTSGLTTAVVVVVGTWLAVNGRLTVGQLTAFLFLVQLFTMPVMQATEVLNEMQNAVAGWRRVIGVIDTPADVADPGPDGVELPSGPVRVALDDVTFAYPGGPAVLREVSLVIEPGTRVAVVGETGSGKTTLAKLACRLVDPTSGVVRLDGVDLRTVRFSSLRRRVVLVPQEGFLFDAPLADNLAYAVPGASRSDVEAVLAGLGLTDWVGGLPLGLDTPVGQRGESLSAGERQLVALARAALADPDLLLLDEATSAVDPLTEVRLQRAIDELTHGRTSIAIAHRLSTAEAADEILVVDAGRIVERGRHTELVAAGGPYSRLHASWVVQTQQA